VSIGPNRIGAFYVMTERDSSLRNVEPTVHPPRDTRECRVMVERQWQRKTEELWKKPCPNATFFTVNPTWTDQGVNLGLHGERPATYRLRLNTNITLLSTSVCLWPPLQTQRNKSTHLFPRALRCGMEGTRAVTEQGLRLYNRRYAVLSDLFVLTVTYVSYLRQSLS
jgi:hypothetical protein